MVETQLMPRGINDDRVLDAFLRVPRHSFVPKALAEASYADHPLPIGAGQTISQPYMVALMTECLALEGGEKVLEIGTGSGYQAAILSVLCREVCTVEKETILQERARQVLAEEGYSNIKFKQGDGTRGWEEEAPFDGIIVTAGAPAVPEALKAQLAEGGRLVIPVGDLFSQMLLLIEKKGDAYLEENVCPCVFVPLIGEFGWKKSGNKND